MSISLTRTASQNLNSRNDHFLNTHRQRELEQDILRLFSGRCGSASPCTSHGVTRAGKGLMLGVNEWTEWRLNPAVVFAEEQKCSALQQCRRDFEMAGPVVSGLDSRTCSWVEPFSWMNERMNERTNKWNEWMNKWMSEWMNEWVNEWMKTYI